MPFSIWKQKSPTRATTTAKAKRNWVGILQILPLEAQLTRHAVEGFILPDNENEDSQTRHARSARQLGPPEYHSAAYSRLECMLERYGPNDFEDQSTAERHENEDRDGEDADDEDEDDEDDEEDDESEDGTESSGDDDPPPDPPSGKDQLWEIGCKVSTFRTPQRVRTLTVERRSAMKLSPRTKSSGSPKIPGEVTRRHRQR